MPPLWDADVQCSRLNPTRQNAAKQHSQNTKSECLPSLGARPASKSMFRPSIPILYPCHTELGVPFSQMQKHNSFMHDWKKWWHEC